MIYSGRYSVHGMYVINWGVKKWRPFKEMITATISFAIATGRLDDRSSHEDDWDENSERE